MNKLDTPAGIGISEAASRIEALLTEPSETETPSAQAATNDKAETEEVEASATDTPADKTPPVETSEDDPDAGEADVTDGEEADEEVTTEDEAEEQADSDITKQTFTVKIGGKEEQVTLEEALKGYQRTVDYTRKSMALAEEKKAFEPEREAVLLERQQYAQLLPVLIQQIEAGLEQEPDWDALIDQNPAEYVRQERLWREKQERLAAARAEQERLKSLAIEEEKAAIGRAIAASGAKLAEAMPQWRDPKRWGADRQKLKEYGAKLGFSEEELEHTYDHRAILALYKAMRYDEIMAKRPKPQPSNGPKPASAGAAAPQNKREVSDITRAKQRLAKTGRVKDAANIFAQLL